MSYIKNDFKEKDYIVTPPIIPEDTRILIPPSKDLCSYIPYEYENCKINDLKSKSLNNYYLPLAKNETIDTLYQKIKSIVRKYNDVDERTISLLSANILGSYFQDRFSTVHYLLIIGDNGTGKSAFGDTFECLGYRAVKVTNVNVLLV
jgi:hypothetical protein